MSGILVFGGTTEGRQVSEVLLERKLAHTVCVATEYGEEVLPGHPLREVLQGRLDTRQMCELLRKRGFALVVDATHPYALEVSKNVRAACQAEQVEYLRYVREETSEPVLEDGAVFVSSAAEAAEYLQGQKGGIFLTTGSKELAAFTEGISDKSRLYVRVLPSAKVLASCKDLGLEGRQICAMQGPFSFEMNVALLKDSGSEFLVTKQTGAAGGYAEKLEAARACGVRPVVIRRPKEEGLSFEELTRRISDFSAEGSECSFEQGGEATGSNMPKTGIGGFRFVSDGNTHGEPAKREQKPESEEPWEISCIGIGPGALETLTEEAKREIGRADILFGAKRMLESVRELISEGATVVPEYRAEKIREYLAKNHGFCRVAVLMSGDVGFYSGARQMTEVFEKEHVRFLCGISSVVYFAARVSTAWEDARLVSAHGKSFAVLNYVKRYRKIIALAGGAADVERICGELVLGGMDAVRVTLGVDLSYPTEQLRIGRPSDFCPCQSSGLHILMIENPDAGYVCGPGLLDETFVRGKVPMTKEEVRTLSISKLRLREDALVYDIGAGTGSVAVECARLCTAGWVYAIERKTEGVELIAQNARSIGVSNLTVLEGMAPAAMEGLPAPTHAFIGGTQGQLGAILESLWKKNPNVRIVINTVSLESLLEVSTLLKELAIEAEVVQESIARARVLGNYHMMTGQNPVYIFSFGGTPC